MQIAFRALQAGDAPALDDAQRIMAQEDFAFAFDNVPGQDFGVYLAQLEENRLGRNLLPGRVRVASTFEVGLFNDRIAARLSVRHDLRALRRRDVARAGGK